MGQESSSLVDDATPPQTLKARTVEELAKYINSGRCRRVVVMVSFNVIRIILLD